MLGLEDNTKLRTLILVDNAISRIEGLETLVDLRVLNLSKNNIGKVQGL